MTRLGRLGLSRTAREFGDPTVDLPAFRGRILRTAADHALLELVDALRLGAISDGDRLPPLAEVAEALGVSLSNTRLALKSLEEAGVVEMKPGRGGGVFVTDLSFVPHALAELYPPVPADEVEVLFEAMFITERDIASLAAEKATEFDIALLESKLGEVEGGFGKSVLDYSERSVRFLIAMATVAGNVFLRAQFAELMNRVAFVTARSGDLRTVSQDEIGRSIEQFRHLFFAVRNCDAGAIDAAVKSRFALQAQLRNHQRH